MSTHTEIRNRQPWPENERRSSAISNIWKNIDTTFDPHAENWVLDGQDDNEKFLFKVASDRETREKAYRLAYEVYSSCGLASDIHSDMVISPYDATFHTITILAEDAEGNPASTFTLILDSAEGLPCDTIYREELKTLRDKGRHLVEVTRLAIAEKHKSAKMLLVTMFNLLSIYSRRVWKATDLVIEVNPRHRKYYERMLLFEQIGGLKSCSRVNGFPALLMRLDLYLSEEKSRKLGGTNIPAKNGDEKTLYPYFRPFGEEYAIAEFLSDHVSPMSIEEIEYFGIDRYSSLQENDEKYEFLKQNIA
ncbi:hypothetical protein ACFL6F_00770 [Planctomycetota bacterium]